MAHKNYGLLTQADKKQALYQGLLQGGARMLEASGPSTQPGGFGRSLGRGAQAFQQGYEGDIEATRGRKAEDYMLERQHTADEQAAEEAKRTRLHNLAIDRLGMASQMGGMDMAGRPVDMKGLAGAAYPELLAKSQFTTAGELPSNVQEWEYYNQLTPDQQNQYLTMRRAQPYLNVGTQMVQPVPTQPGQVGGAIPITPKPGEMPEFKAKVETAVGEAKLGVGQPELQNKAKLAFQDLTRQTEVVESTIDKAIALITPWSTGYGSMLDFMPETDARELRNMLDTVRANVGFDKLQRMRDASPTGGALGQVSEMENRLLQATSGALDPAQSNQLRENLTTIKELYKRVLDEKQAAFESDFGASPADITPIPVGEIDLGGFQVPQGWTEVE